MHATASLYFADDPTKLVFDGHFDKSLPLELGLPGPRGRQFRDLGRELSTPI